MSQAMNRALRAGLFVALALLIAAPAGAQASNEVTPGYQMIERFVGRIVTNDINQLLSSDSGTPGCVGNGQVALCLAPDTPPEVAAELLRRLPTYAGDDRYTLNGRWSTTAMDGYTGLQGNPINITYSFLPDGTFIPSGSGEPAGPSVLYAEMASHFASEAIWKQKFADIFALWSEHIGITYHEVDDDGAAFPTSLGSIGNRGDVRIGSHNIDGGSNVLAYNYFPGSGGDMVLDSSENWGNAGNDYIFMTNIIAHEHGHGHGLSHVEPLSCTKLMEPNYCANFRGPRDDDIRGGMRNYGDYLEPNGAWDEYTDIGALNGTVVFATPSITSSLDKDWYRFQMGGRGTLSVTVHPVGSAYQVDGVVVFTHQICDLAFQIWGGAEGDVLLGTINQTGVGQDEVLTNFAMEPGTYWIQVLRAAGQSDVQRYDMTVTLDNPTAVAEGNAPMAGMGLGVYPNPFNPKTTARFFVEQAGPVSLEIFNVAGGLVRTIDESAASSGWMEMIWSGKNDRGEAMPSGIYFLRASSVASSETIRAVLLK